MGRLINDTVAISRTLANQALHFQEFLGNDSSISEAKKKETVFFRNISTFYLPIEKLTMFFLLRFHRRIRETIVYDRNLVKLNLSFYR